MRQGDGLSRPAILLRFLFVVAALVVAVPGAAGYRRWTPFGPGAGAVWSIAAAPTRPLSIFVTDETRTLFRSTDRGKTWVWRGAGLPARSRAVWIDPLHPRVLWASSGGNLFRSEDGGGSWTRVWQVPGGENERVSMAVAAGEKSVFAGRGKVLFRSRDRGAHWEHVWTSPWPIRVLAVDSTAADTVYAGLRAVISGTKDIGFWRSVDGGDSWIPSHRTLDGEDLYSVWAIVTSPAAPGTVWVVNDWLCCRSLDRGATWHEGGPCYRSGLLVDPFDPKTLWNWSDWGEGLARSTDGGMSWVDLSFLSTPEGDGIEPVYGMVADPFLPGTFYAATSDYAVLVTHDNGLTWTSKGNSGLDREERRIWYLGFHPEAPDDVFMSRSGEYEPGLYHSPDGGRTWEPWGADQPAVSDLAFVPGDKKSFYAAAGDGVFRIEENGQRWLRLGIDVRPRDRGSFYAIERVNKRTLIAGGFPGLYHSTDGGATWTQVMKPYQIRNLDDPTDNVRRYIRALDADPAAPATVYATAHEWIPGQSFSGPVVYRSHDGGATWHKVLHGGRVALVPGQPGRLYGVTLYGAVLTSTDAGATWRQVGRMKPQMVLSIVVDLVEPETLYVATRDGGIQRSTDGGEHWRPASAGLDQQEWTVQGLVAHPRDRHRFFAITLFHGLFEALFPDRSEGE